MLYVVFFFVYVFEEYFEFEKIKCFEICKIVIVVVLDF